MSRLRGLGELDWVLLITPVLLLGVGLTMIYSLGLAQGRLELFWNQLVFGAIGIGLMLLVARSDYRLLYGGSLPLYLVLLGLLVAVLFLGESIFGARRWIDVGPVQFQPAELMKLGLILMVGRILADRIGAVSWRHYLAVLVVTAPALALVLIEPDLGTAALLGVTAAGMLLASRLSWQQLLLSVIGGLLVLGLGWVSLEDYQRQRIETFVNPGSDPQGTSYNVRQSEIAIGSGGWFGQGIGRGSQSQLNFLPVAHTDFMFATVAEASGLVGATVLIGCYLLLIFRLVRLAELTTDSFGMLVAVGAALLLLTQVVVNIGMNMGLLPVTGIPLPLVSHGGSSVIATYLLLGILQSIYRRRKKIEF